MLKCTQTDHMLTIPWNILTGWGRPKIGQCKPYIRRVRVHSTHCLKDAPLVLEPSATVFHYAQTLFEGMKAYRDQNGKVTLFRPDMNMKRMNNSAKRLALPVSVFHISYIFQAWT